MSQAPTLVVVLTPPGRAAIAVTHVCGPTAVDAVGRYFHSPRGSLAEQPLNRILFGRWEGDTGEEVVVCRCAEQEVEVHSHGGRAAVERIVGDLCRAGCHTAPWTEWPARSEGDPFAAEARLALAKATTLRTAGILLDQCRGALRQAVVRLLQQMQRPSDAHDASDRVGEQLATLLRRGELGRHLTRPWRVVLAGRPNVGKSSLINALIGYRRAIVSDQPGTTRDVLVAQAAVEGWPIELADTAGLRETEDVLEAAGVQRTRSTAQEAELLLLVFDAAQPFTAQDEKLLADWPDAVLVHSKCDLGAARLDDRPPGCATSAATGEGIARLVQTIARRLVPSPPPPGSAVPFTPRHCTALQDASTAWQRGDREASRAALEGMLQAAMTANPVC